MNKLTVFKCNGAANIPVLLVRCITASQGYLDHGRSELFSFVAVTWWLCFTTKVHFNVDVIAKPGRVNLYLDKRHIQWKVQTRAKKMKKT